MSTVDKFKEEIALFYKGSSPKVLHEIFDQMLYALDALETELGLIRDTAAPYVSAGGSTLAAVEHLVADFEQNQTVRQSAPDQSSDSALDRRRQAARQYACAALAAGFPVQTVKTVATSMLYWEEDELQAILESSTAK